MSKFFSLLIASILITPCLPAAVMLVESIEIHFETAELKQAFIDHLETQKFINTYVNGKAVSLPTGTKQNAIVDNPITMTQSIPTNPPYACSHYLPGACINKTCFSAPVTTLGHICYTWPYHWVRFSVSDNRIPAHIAADSKQGNYKGNMKAWAMYNLLLDAMQTGHVYKGPKGQRTSINFDKAINDNNGRPFFTIVGHIRKRLLPIGGHDGNRKWDLVSHKTTRGKDNISLFINYDIPFSREREYIQTLDDYAQKKGDTWNSIRIYGRLIGDRLTPASKRKEYQALEVHHVSSETWEEKFIPGN